MTSMATPPPEATTFPKEDKPQLPPSPNGFNIGDKGYVFFVIAYVSPTCL